MSGEWLFGTCELGKFRNNTLGFDSKLLLVLADSATLHSQFSEMRDINCFFIFFKKREVLLIRLNQQLVFPSHLSFALLLLSQVHVYCLFSHTHFFSFLYVSFHGLNLSCFGGYYSCLLKVMYVKFPSFVYLSRSYFLSQLFYLLPPLMGSSIRCETRVWKCRYGANIRYTVHAMRLSRGGGCYSNFTTGVNLLGTWVI